MVHKFEIVVKVWDQTDCGNRKLNFVRPFNHYEVDLVVNILNVLQKERVTAKLDKDSWKEARSVSFLE